MLIVLLVLWWRLIFILWLELGWEGGGVDFVEFLLFFFFGLLLWFLCLFGLLVWWMNVGLEIYILLVMLILILFKLLLLVWGLRMIDVLVWW